MTDAPRAERHLAWEGCYNVRDLGGLPLEGGGETLWRSVIRADLLRRLTPAGWRALRAYGVRTVVDLRSPREVDAEPSHPAGLDEGADALTYVNRPLETYDPDVSALMGRAESRAEAYAIVLDHYPAAVAAALRAIAAAAPGGVVIHCHAGKDRTGIVAGLLLGLTGVEERAIAEDYAESQTRLWPLYEALAEEAGGEENLDFWLRPTATAETMHALLGHLRVVYGGVEGYVRRAGLSPDEVERLRRRLRPA